MERERSADIRRVCEWFRKAVSRAIAATLLAAAVFGQEIHLKTRDVYTGPPEPGRVVAQVQARHLGPSHQIVQFDHPPGVEDLDALLAAGVRVIAAIPDNAVS